MLIKKLLNLKNILLPILLIFGLTGFAGQSFAAKSRDHDKASSKVVKKKPTQAKKVKTGKKTKKAKTAKKAKKPTKDRHKTKKTTKTTKAAKAKKTTKDMHKSKKSKTHAKKPKSSKTHTSKSVKTKNTKTKAHHDYEQDQPVGTRDDGRTIYEGPRGGRYYINDSGNKVYIQR